MLDVIRCIPSFSAKKRAAEEAALAALQSEKIKDSKTFSVNSWAILRIRSDASLLFLRRQQKIECLRRAQVFAVFMAVVCVLLGAMVMVNKTSSKQALAAQAEKERAKKKEIEDKIIENNKKAASADGKENTKVNPQPQAIDRKEMESSSKKVANAKRNNAPGQVASFGGVVSAVRAAGCYLYAHICTRAHTSCNVHCTAEVHTRSTPGMQRRHCMQTTCVHARLYARACAHAS